MRKFLLPIINLVNIILVSITFGLGSNTALTGDTYAKRGNWYSLVWEGSTKGPNIVGIIGFFLFVVAVAGLLIAFIPFKQRKIVTLLVGAMLIGSGVMMLLTPDGSMRNVPVAGEMSDSLIAMAVLVFIAGALTIAMSIIEMIAKEEK